MCTIFKLPEHTVCTCMKFHITRILDLKLTPVAQLYSYMHTIAIMLLAKGTVHCHITDYMISTMHFSHVSHV